MPLTVFIRIRQQQLDLTQLSSTLFADLRAGDFQSISATNHAGPIYRYQLTKNDGLVYNFYETFYLSLLV